MRPRPPECTDALLALLRSKRLLDDEALSRLSAAWDGDDAPGPHIDELVTAELLTPFQAEHVRDGRTGRLRLGPYRLVERLGRAVYRAEHTLLGRTVVVKVLGRRRPHPPTPSSAGRGGAGGMSEIGHLPYHASYNNPRITSPSDSGNGRPSGD